MEILHAEQGRVKLELKVEKEHLNRVKTVHGGLLSTIVDIGGSLAVASKGLFATGVSTDLNVTFLAPAKLGDKVIADAKLVKLGKTLAFTTVEVLLEDGRVVAQGRHTKFVALAYENPKNILQELSTENKN